jgi:hypothetical protein
MLINTEDLLEELYSKFPDRVPDKVTDMRELGIKVGEQRAMKFIEFYVERLTHTEKQKSKE